MIDPAARGAWRDLEAKLRPFVARRVRSDVDVDDIVQDVFLRMQRVLWLLSRPGQPQSLANLAQTAGYADQAHLTREMRALTGQLPTTLVTGNPQSAVADLFKTPLA